MTATGHTLPQEVHLVPIYREVDRAVLPFVGSDGRPPALHAHRVLLLVLHSEPARRTAERVERQLRRLSVVERHFLQADRPTGTGAPDFEQVVDQIAHLCVRELEAGNRLHINLTSGSKLVSFAAGLVGMAHLSPGQGSIYYVRPAGYAISQSEFEEHGLSTGLLDVHELQLTPLLLPAPLRLRLLAHLRRRRESETDYRDLVRFLAGIPGSGYAERPRLPGRSVRRWNNAVTTRMVRNLVAPLAADGLLEVRTHGRQKMVRITARGRLYASLSGLAAGDLRRPL